MTGGLLGLLIVAQWSELKLGTLLFLVTGSLYLLLCASYIPSMCVYFQLRAECS